MTVTMSAARGTYNKRKTPESYQPGFFDVELGNIQRAIPSTKTRTVRAAYTADVTDNLILGDCTAGAFAVTLPNPARVQGAVFTIKKIDVSAHALTVGGTIDGVANPTLATQNKSMTVQSDGTAYWKLASV